LRRQEGDVSMEAIHTDAGATGTAQSLFGKASGQAGKGGGVFAALLALVGRHVGDVKELDQTGDGSANAAAGLQGLLALFNPAMANGQTTADDQTLFGDSGSDPLVSVASANGLDLSQLSDRSKLALLAQALADVRNGDAPAPSDAATTDRGIALDPTATDQTMSRADLDAILAELRARAAAKFGVDNGKPALTRDGMDAALAQKADASAPAATTPTGPNPAPFIKDATLGLGPDNPAPAVSDTDSVPTSPATPAPPAVAAGSFVSIETDADSDKPADSSAAADEEEAPTPAIDGESTAPAAPADGEAPPSKTPDTATSPFQKVEVAPPQDAKSGPREPVHAAAAVDSDRKPEPKPEPAAATATDEDRADKTAADDNSRATGNSDDAGSTGDSNPTANTASVDPRSHAAARAVIQVPAEKLSQFLTQDDQLPLQIQRAVANGRDHITIQIVPHDLGRIEIKLDFDRAGTINTVIAADRPQTLDLLRRDAGGLERALQDAGFKTDGSSLSFNLQGDQRQQYQNQQNNPGPAAWQSSAAEEAERSYRPTYRIASTADAIRAAADGRVNIAV
jgi:flagellar hook-length control protein FliK